MVAARARLAERVSDAETGRLLELSSLRGEVARKMMSWIRDFVSEQFWIPTLTPQLVIQRQDPSVRPPRDEAPQVKPVDVFDSEGTALEHIQANGSARLSGDGALDVWVRVGGATDDEVERLEACLDLHGRGLLRIPRMGPVTSPMPETGTVELHFRETGFDHVPMRIPETEYALVLMDRTGSRREE